MKKHTLRILSLLIALVLAIISCRLFSPAPEPDVDVEQSVAQTMAAMETNQQPEELVTPPDSPGKDDVDDQDDELDSDLPPAASTPTPEPTDTVNVTETPCDPTVQVSVNTNCRVGPGPDYARVGSLLVGQTARVVGRNTDSTYWIIERPGGAGHCWLWGAHATVTCETTYLAIYEPPPTPTARQATVTRTPTATRTPTVTQTPYDGGEIYYSCSRLLTLSPGSYVSLANCQRLQGSGGDLLYTTGLELMPLSGTRFGIWGSSNPESLDCANHTGLSASTIHRDSLAVGTRVCFWTGENRIGFFEVLAKDSPVTGNIQIHVRTWMTYR